MNYYPINLYSFTILSDSVKMNKNCKCVERFFLGNNICLMLYLISLLGEKWDENPLEVY